MEESRVVDPRLFWEHTERTGEVICQICCESKPKDQMEPVVDNPGVVWDVCKVCVSLEKVKL
jgi:hypothetical protein